MKFIIHFFFFGSCLDFVSQNGICLYAAVWLNFLPQNLHCTILHSVASFSSFDIGLPFAAFMLARNAKLSAFHLGIFPLFCYFAGFFSSLFLGMPVVFMPPLSKPSDSGARCAAESNAFLLLWKTFWQIFSCFSIACTLNILPHP